VDEEEQDATAALLAKADEAVHVEGVSTEEEGDVVEPAPKVKRGRLLFGPRPPAWEEEKGDSDDDWDTEDEEPAWLFSSTSEEEEDDITCNNCGRGDDETVLLLCDGPGCNAAQHTYCCTPPLAAPPTDEVEWFCDACSAGDPSSLTAAAAAPTVELFPSTAAPPSPPSNAPSPFMMAAAAGDTTLPCWPLPPPTPSPRRQLRRIIRARDMPAAGFSLRAATPTPPPTSPPQHPSPETTTTAGGLDLLAVAATTSGAHQPVTPPPPLADYIDEEEGSEGAELVPSGRIPSWRGADKNGRMTARQKVKKLWMQVLRFRPQMSKYRALVRGTADGDKQKKKK